MDKPTPATRLESLSDDVLMLIVVLLFKTGNFPLLRALALTSTRFLALLGKTGIAGPLAPNELPVLGHIGNEFDQQWVTKVMRRVRRFKEKPWAYLAAWKQSALISNNFRKCLFAPLAAEAACCGSAVLSTLIPQFLTWIKSCKPQEQKALLIELRKAVRDNYRPEMERRPWEILERRIVRAGDGWTPDPTSQEAIRGVLELLKAGPLGAAADPATAASLRTVVINGLPELPENEVDAAWWTLRNNIILLHEDVLAEPLFALALCIPCLSSEPMRVKAFKDIAARTKKLFLEDQVVMTEGLVECLGCIPAAVQQPWRQWLLQSASKYPLFLPVYGASLKTLESKEREGGFTKIFEMTLPDDPDERARCLELLSQWVEFLNSDARSEVLEGLVQGTLETQDKLIELGMRDPKDKRWESIATHLVCQAHALSADQVAAMVPTYTRLILGSRCSKSTVLAALLSTICVPSNQHVLGAVFEHVLNTALPLFPWPKDEGRPDSRAMAGVLEWIKCQCVVASFLRYLPPKAFESVSTLLLGRLEHVLQRLEQWRDVDERVEGSFREDSALMLPVYQALMDLLRCVSPLAEPSQAWGAYMKKLLQLGLLARHGGIFTEELVVSFAERAHLLPPEDQLSLIDLLMEFASPDEFTDECVLLPKIYANGVLFANVHNRVALCARVIKSYRAYMSKDAPWTLGALRTILRQLIETLPENVASPIREEYEALMRNRVPAREPDTDSSEEADENFS